MSKPGAAAAPVGIGPDGVPPLPWLGGVLSQSGALDKAHAVLIVGPAGAGHLNLALLMAQAALCEQAAPPAATLAGRMPCGRCKACHLVNNRAHTDLLIVIPDQLRVQLDWVDDEDSKLTKPDAKPSKDIRVEQVRQAIAWSQQTNGRGRGKVMVVHPADALNGPAANALLKTLEEPPGSMRLLLTSADPERLLPTVRSRCQRLRLDLPALAQANAWLKAQGLDDPEPLLKAAGGSPLEALAWAAEGLTAPLLAALPRRIAAGDAGTLTGRPIPRVVDLLLRLCHDLQVHAVGGAPRYFDAQQLPAPANLQALRAWQAALLRAARHDGHAWNGGLLIESLVSQAAPLWVRASSSGPVGASLHSRR